MEHSFVRPEKSSNRVSHMLLSLEFPGFGIDKIKKKIIAGLVTSTERIKKKSCKEKTLERILCTSTKYQSAHTYRETLTTIKHCGG